MKISKTTGKTKETKTTKEVKAKTIKNHRENQKNKKQKTFRPMSTLADMGLKVLFVWVVLVFSMAFDSFCLDLVGCFGFFGFPYGF